MYKRQDFTAIKDAPRRDDEKRSRRGRERGGVRSRSRSTEPVETAEATPAVAAPEVAAEAPPRTRSRRKTRTDVVETVVSEPMDVVEVVETPRASPPEQEPQLLQSDRRGERKSTREEPQRQGSRGFGDDIPAFLRRPVVIPA